MSKCSNLCASSETADIDNDVYALWIFCSSSNALLLDDNVSLACYKRCENELDHAYFAKASISNLRLFLLLFELFLLDNSKKKRG